MGRDWVPFPLLFTKIINKTMAIDKRFLYYTTEAGFLNDKNKGNINNKSVAFISANGKRAIYTHGKFFSAEAFVVGTQTASTNAFIGTFNEVDELYDGLNIRYWLPYNGTSSAATLNLTINGTQTGAIPVYVKGTTRFTNHIGGTNVLDLTYRENVGGIEKGWWVLGSYGDAADGNTTYTFTSGESGSFKVKPSNGTEQEVSVGKPETAGTADKVEKNLVIQINSGSEEYVSKYTYNGSSAKTLNIIQGSNINFGVEDGELIINGAYQNASTTSNGLMSSDDKKKLNGISEGAEVNQNAFSKIKIGDTLIEADTKTDELTLEAGSNITLTPDTAGDKIIISAKDTTYTNATTSKDGLMSSEDKTKLDGIDEEANNYVHPSHTEYASGLYKIKIDEEGHVEAAVGVTKSDITALGIPAQDTDTHYESKNVVGSSTSSTTNTTSVLSNGNVYLNSIENGSVTSSHKISGSGNTTVKTDASGNIIVNSPTTIAWGSVTGKPSTFTPSDHDHTVSDITDFPETQELSVNGTAYDVYTSETSLPSFYAPSTLGSNGQVLKSDGSKLVWSSDKNDNTWRGIALTDGTTDTTVLGTGTNTGSLKFKAGNNVNLSADSGVITINSSYVDTDTTYTFASGTNGSFSVTPKNGSKQTVSIGKPSEAGIADEVSNPFTITVNSGTEEGTDKYTFTGADSKTLNITAGSNVTLTPSAGGLQISSSFTNTDTKAKVTTGTTTKSYLVGVNSSGYTSGNATDKFITDTGVYLDTTSGKLTATTLNATTLSGNLKGTIDSTTTATTPSAGDKSTKVATTAFVDTAISTALGSLADAMIFKGIVNANTDLPASHEVGWTYRVGTKGTYAGATCEVGDLIICITAGTSASNAHWTIAQNNIDGAVTGPTSATDGNFALFSGSTGKIIKNSSYSPASFTYTAGTGLKKTGNEFAVDSSLIEGTYGPEANVTGTNGTTVVIPQIKVDENGLISEISEFTYTSKDTNTHYTTGLYVGASGAKSNAATSNGSTYLKLYDNDTSRASFKISGSGATTVKSDASGNITISSTDNNTTYSLSGALDGDTFKSTLTPSSGTATTSVVPVFSGATSSAAGKAGLVPSPESSESSLYLKADGTWSKPTDTTYSAATTTTAGLMSAADKEKLDGIATGANKYTHPTYTSKSSGLYKITVNGTGHVSAATAVAKSDIIALGIPAQDTTYDVMTGATSSADGESGLVPTPEAGENELYLRGDGTWAKPTDTVYSHPTYTARTGKPTANATPSFGGTFTVSQITSNTLGHVTGATDRTITIPNTTATTSTAGLMSASDKTKLDGIATGANKYTLPEATTSDLGGIKIAKDNASYTVTTSTSSISDNVTSGKYYGVELDSTGKAFVYVPWTDTNTKYTAMTASEATTGTSTTARSITAKVLHDKISEMLPDVMTGATSSVAGTSGLVPASAAGDQNKFLRADGTWVVPTNTTYSGDRGISLVSGKFGHSNTAITAKTAYASTATTASANGGTIKVTDIKYDAYGHITGSTDRTITLSEAYKGTVTSVKITQGTGITVSSSGTAITSSGERTISLNTATDSIIGGMMASNVLESEVTLTSANGSTASRYYGVQVDSTGKAFVNVPWTDTNTNTTTTTGSTNKIDTKMYLVGAQTQATAPTTYSNVNVYIGTDNCLYSNGTKVSIDGHTHNYAASSHTHAYTTLTGSGTTKNQAIVSSGTTNGWTLYTLGDAAAKGTTTSVTSGSTALVTSGGVYTAIQDSLKANDAMVFKGTLGTNGTVTALPAEHNVGWTYRVITAGTYAGKNCEIGDLIICITDGTSANDAHWTVAQTNIDGAVVGPTSSVNNRVAVFNGTTGKIIKDSGYTIAASVPSGAKFTDTVYTHPTFTQRSSGLYKITVDSEGHVSGATAVVKADITALGIPGSNTTYSIGDYDTSGLIKPWKSYSVSCTGPTAATSATAVTVQNISTTSDRYYAVEMDKDGRAFVNVPWVDTNTNTDTKVNVTLATTSKAYLIGVTTAPTATAAAMTTVSDTGVYLDTTAGVLTATTFKGALSGNASSATYASNVRITATTSAGTYYPSWTSGTTSGTDYMLRGNSNFTYRIVTGTTSAQGYDTIYLGNSTASGTANNSAGRLLLYSSSTSYHTLVGDATTSTVAHTLPTTGGTILNTGTTSITAVQTSGAHIATLKINGADTKLYAPNNPNLGLGTEATNSTASTLIKSISVSGHTITVTKYNGTIGSTTKPAYFNAGVPTVCSTYAGGTKVTLNGTEKGASTASFYAPTAAGTEGYILVANSSGIPVWKDYGAIDYKSGTVTKAITTSWAEFISNTNMATYCPASGTYVVQVYSSTIRYNSGIFSWNSAGTSDDEILLHRCGAGTNIYLKIVNGALHIAGASAVASGSINVKIKRLI